MPYALSAVVTSGSVFLPPALPGGSPNQSLQRQRVHAEELMLRCSSGLISGTDAHSAWLRDLDNIVIWTDARS